MSQCDFEVDDFDDKYLYPMAAEKEFADSQFPLCIRRMKQHQDEDTSIQKLIKKTKTDRYNITEVEGLFLVHDHNRIFVLMSMSDKVLQWYHLLQVHLGEKIMEKIIYFVYIWKGLKVDAKRVCKHYHGCQMSKNFCRKKCGLVPKNKGETTR